MKHPRILLSLLSLFVAIGGLSTGCQSRKSPALAQGTSASESIQSAAETIVAARVQVKYAVAALRNLTERPGDAVARYKVVEKQLVALEDSAAKIAKAADAMRTKGDAYLADWARQISVIGDPELRTAAFGRRAEVAAKLQNIFRSYQKVQADFVPFRASLADIQRTLGSDLSPKGLEAVTPFVEKAANAAEPLKASLDKLAEEFRAAGVTLRPAAPGM